MKIQDFKIDDIFIAINSYRKQYSIERIYDIDLKRNALFSCAAVYENNEENNEEDNEEYTMFNFKGETSIHYFEDKKLYKLSEISSDELKIYQYELDKLFKFFGEIEENKIYMRKYKLNLLNNL